MIKLIYKILDIFDMCKHDYGYTKFSITEHSKTQLSVLEWQTCSKCGDKRYKHYLQEKI